MMWPVRVSSILNLVTYGVFYWQPWEFRPMVEWLMSWNMDNPVYPLFGATIVVFSMVNLITLGTYWLLYKLEIPFFEQWRIEKWKSKDPNYEQDQAALVNKTLDFFWRKRLEEVVFLVGVAWMLNTWWPYKRADAEHIIATTPSRFTFAWQMLVGLVIFETIFYWGHRLQHRYLYQYHKIHHEYVNPHALTGVWGHATDGLFTIVLPGVVPFLLFKMHIYTFLWWYTVHVFHTYYDHAGYAFPWCPFQLIPFSGYTKEHYFHHSHNVGNFGLYWDFWDNLCGTNAYKKDQQKRIAAAATNGNGNGNGHAKSS